MELKWYSALRFLKVCEWAACGCGDGTESPLSKCQRCCSSVLTTPFIPSVIYQDAFFWEGVQQQLWLFCLITTHEQVATCVMLRNKSNPFMNYSLLEMLRLTKSSSGGGETCTSVTACASMSLAVQGLRDSIEKTVMDQQEKWSHIMVWLIGMEAEKEKNPNNKLSHFFSSPLSHLQKYV